MNREQQAVLSEMFDDLKPLLFGDVHEKERAESRIVAYTYFLLQEAATRKSPAKRRYARRLPKYAPSRGSAPIVENTNEHEG